jgi:hypothetical protein
MHIQAFLDQHGWSNFQWLIFVMMFFFSVALISAAIGGNRSRAFSRSIWP